MATLKRKTNNGYEPLPAMVVRKTNAENGNGIGTCSTSSGTALTVSLTGYELVTNGIVAVTFENDVPANATLNINSKGAKPIYYKGSAIEADTIKADDTALFSYDGTNYVLCSSGAGGAVEIVEYLSIDISCNFPTQASDLIGATVTVTDNDNQETLFSTTWQGTTIEYEVPAAISYTITVGSVSGYTTPGTKTFRAVANNERAVTFEYIDSEKIDLGLPSGTLWCSHNVGATNQTQRGYYFSWGNIVGHNLNAPASPEYSFSTANYDSTPGKQLTAAFTSGDSRYDAARAIMGGSWRMPTLTEINELFNNTNKSIVTINGVTGYKFAKITDSSVYIFFPQAGWYQDSTIKDETVAFYRTCDYNGWGRFTNDNGAVAIFTRSGTNYGTWSTYGYGIRAVI